MIIECFSTTYQLSEDDTAYFLKINDNEVICVSTSENCPEPSDYVWNPSEIYRLNDPRIINAKLECAKIDDEDVYQIPETLLNYFLKVATDYRNSDFGVPNILI